ncbi:MAG: hypothetical protein OEZ06_09195 [Myxococcales bacterium]|nr:hypothetical protein [Myxococcales bacterium]
MLGEPPLPADVDAILEARCRACHARPTARHAPMPLVSWQDVVALAPSVESEPVYEIIGRGLVDERAPMPPSRESRLSHAELQRLLAWVQGCAPPGPRGAAAETGFQQRRPPPPMQVHGALVMIAPIARSLTLAQLLTALCVSTGCAADTDDGARETPDASAHDYVPCDAEMTPFALNMVAEGESGLVLAKLLNARPAPPQKFINDWTLEFSDADGKALSGIEITMARTWMPAHAHDGRVAPVVTDQGEGVVQFDDLNLWMRGAWEIQIEVLSDGQGDRIVFDVCIEE